jgi:acetylornithine aminotransferase
MLVEDKIVEHGRKMGDYFKDKLLGLKQRHECIEDVRGMGLLLGMKLKADGGAVVNQCLENGYVINCIQDTILRFIPPLVVTEKEIDGLVGCLDQILGDLAK